MNNDKLSKFLNIEELRLFRKLKSPKLIQDYLDTLSINFETSGETYMSPRRVIKNKTAHCFEGALLAAAALSYHGHKPLLLDLVTIERDEDHVVALFRQNGLWGAISKTNHPILRYRDPVYKTVRELAMSYFHEYLLDDGRKSLRAYSRPFSLTRYPVKTWVTAEKDLHFLVEALDSSHHFPIVPGKTMRLLRKASRVETKAMNIVEWPELKKSKSRPN